MDKKYFFNNSDVSFLINKYFPIKNFGLRLLLDEDALTEENLNGFFTELNFLLDDITVKETLDESKDLEDFDISLGDAYDKLKELFKDEDLVLFGHGGMCEEIMESGHFQCKYANLDSHFLPLEWSEDLNALNHWRHRDASQILILALNKNEVNPIFKDLHINNPYSAFRYEIPLEYFPGYYDREKKEFIVNQSFKREHAFNPDLTITTFNSTPTLLDNKSKDAIDFYHIIERLAITILFSHNGLSKNGYDSLREQVNHSRKILHEKLESFFIFKNTTDLLDELEQPSEEQENTLSDEDNWIGDWDFDEDWGVEDSGPKL